MPITKQKLNPKDVRVEQLNVTNKANITTFSSTVCKELDAFLKENAWDEQLHDFSKTYLFFHKCILAGYVTILTDKQPLKMSGPTNPKLTKFEHKSENGYSSVPALKIGRLCVSDGYNSQVESTQYCGLGNIIFASVLDFAREIKDKVGCRVITTHAKKSTKAYNWYKKIGFEFSYDTGKTSELLTRDNVESVPMFFDISRIIR